MNTNVVNHDFLNKTIFLFIRNSSNFQKHFAVQQESMLDKFM